MTSRSVVRGLQPVSHFEEIRAEARTTSEYDVRQTQQGGHTRAASLDAHRGSCSPPGLRRGGAGVCIRLGAMRPVALFGVGLVLLAGRARVRTAAGTGGAL